MMDGVPRDASAGILKSSSSSSYSSLSSSHNNNVTTTSSARSVNSSSDDNDSSLASLHPLSSLGIEEFDYDDGEGMSFKSSGNQQHRSTTSNSNDAVPEHQVLSNYREVNEQSTRRLVEYFLVISPKVANNSEKCDSRMENDIANRKLMSFSEAHLRAKPDGVTGGDEEAHSKAPLSKLLQTHYHPAVTARYPLIDHEDNPLNPMVTHFCHPTLPTAIYNHNDTASSASSNNVNYHRDANHVQEVIEPQINYSMPKLHYFVLTNSTGRRMYGTCLTIYEPYELDINRTPTCKSTQATSASSSPSHQHQQKIMTSTIDNSSPERTLDKTPIKSSGSDNLVIYEEEVLMSPFFLPRIEVTIPKEQQTGCTVNNHYQLSQQQEQQQLSRPRYYYLPRCLLILSTWPYLEAFRDYLTHLYRQYFSGSMEVPLERYILNLCCEIAAPPPGTFEVQCILMNKKIKFWAPPANQPIAWVALPFEYLFECLSIQNVITVWHALVLEKQILLVSSQLSLLTICSEILTSLLFPMNWPHLYLPVVPQFLLQILDAPMPYLCGVSQENLFYSRKHGFLSRECIVVDLDVNKIAFGKQTPSYPPIPERRRYKLIKGILNANAGCVFHKAREASPAAVRSPKQANMMKPQEWDDGAEAQDVMESNFFVRKVRGVASAAEKTWKERLVNFDVAYNLAFTPDSATLLNYEGGLNQTDHTKKQYQQSASIVAWDVVQASFFNFFVSILQDYRKFLIRKNSSFEQGFRTSSFVKHSRIEYQPFLQIMCGTQQFDAFLTKRLYDPGQADVTFFDQSIDAKRNRSRLNLKKVGTPFLLASQTNKKLRVIIAVQPNNSNLFEEKTNNLQSPPSPPELKIRGMFSAPRWPETFNESLFTTPRPIPSVIDDEFDRQGQISERLRRKFVQLNDPIYGDSNPSPEVATFTLFFVTFLSFVGRALEEILDEGDAKASAEDSPVHNSDDSGLKRRPRQDSLIEEERDIALSELDLAFEVMTVLHERGYTADFVAHKSLVEACGRCGDTNRATQALAMVIRDGYKPDSTIYSRLIDAFSLRTPRSQYDSRAPAYSAIDWKQLTKLKKEASKKSSVHLLPEPDFFASSVVFPASSQTANTSAAYDASSGPLSNIHVPSLNELGFINGLYSTVASVTSQFSDNRAALKGNNKRLKKMNATSFLVTEPVLKQVILGENILEMLYPDLCIDTHSETCPQCQQVLTDQDIICGWKPCDSQDYTTTCPHCTRRFVARFSVSCSDPAFVGSHGYFSSLFCEYLSPWVLLKELRNILSASDGLREMLQPRWRSGDDINARLWWNMIVAFVRYRLPITFLLQGSFRNRLIFPTPNDSSTQ